MKWNKVKGLRLTYEIELNGVKGYNLTRFGIYKAPFISCGDRDRDRAEYNWWLEEKYGYTLKDFPDYRLHHHVDGTMMLVPYEIHKIKHLGFIGAQKALSTYMKVV